MKKIIGLFFLVNILICSHAQTNNASIDSAKKALHSAKEDTSKVQLLVWIFNYYQDLEIDSALYYSKEALQLSSNLNYQWGIGKAYGIFCSLNISFGNYAKALDYGLKCLRIFEKLNDPVALADTYSRLGQIARNQNNFNEALRYFRKALVVDEEIQDPAYKAIHLSNISTTFLNLNLPDSALQYGEAAYNLWRHATNQKFMGRALIRIAESHFRLGNNDLAFEYCKMGIKKSLGVNNLRLVGEGYSKLSEMYINIGAKDSALIYARKSWVLFDQLKTKNKLVEVSALLAKVYKAKGNLDSAYKYQEQVTLINDSLSSETNITQTQNLNFEEKLRQQEITATELKANEERKHNLQYAAIAVALITFLILFFTLSRSIIVKTKFIEFFGVLGLLAVFEFINLFIHPYLSHATNDSPVLMLLILIGIGALLVPLHHRLEKWITRVMVEKNKKIRLAAAKRTIEQLEG
jgi:tetratricopeptide (TPR) repeat protein